MTCDSSSKTAFFHASFAVAGNKGGGQQEAHQASTDDKANPFQIKKKTKKAAQPLCRPIIAVCNDMYAPALRPLKGVAKIVQFKKPSVSNPLSYVCLFWFSVLIKVAFSGHCSMKSSVGLYHASKVGAWLTLANRCKSLSW